MRTFPIGTSRTPVLGCFFLATAMVAVPAGAQTQERSQNQDLTFSLGGIPGQTRSFKSSSVGIAKISADRSFGINYGHHLLGAKVAALYGEIELAWNPTDKPEWLDEKAYRESIQPRLASITVPTIMSALSISEPYALRIRGGRCVPHRRHWLALAGLTGISGEK